MAWTSAKVFISSTFRDMQAERDWLVRFVFPRLRAHLRRRRVHLVDVDLRWGITAEDNVVDACTGIIDECRPHFLAILGGRYGYVPAGDDLSITHREIRHALSHEQADRPHLLFFARDPSVHATIEAGERSRYVEPSQSSANERLNDLRTDITGAGVAIETYSCRWDPREKRLVDLEAFGAAVYERLLQNIEAGLPSTTPAADNETDATEAFIEACTVRFIAGDRGPILETLERFCLDGPSGTVCLAGESGTGKSALLAYLLRHVLEPARQRGRDRPLTIIPVFAGVSPESTDARLIMRRIFRALGADEASVPDEFDELKDGLHDLLATAAATTDVVLLLDGVDQLSASHHGPSLYWLPATLPDGARVVISTSETWQLEVIRARRPEPLVIKLEPLDVADAAKICDVFLAAHRKRFEPRQRARLLAKTHARHPLYLTVALEELRTLGSYEEIDARIAELPERTPELFGWLLRRLTRDPIFSELENKPLVRRFFTCLYASRGGLTSEELAALTSPGDPGGHVAALERLVRPYLMQAGDLLTFQHSALRDAVADVFLRGNETGLVTAHRDLALFFRHAADPLGGQHWNGAQARPLQELVYHLLEVPDTRELLELHQHIGFLEAFCERVGIRELVLNLQQIGAPLASLARLCARSAVLLRRLPGSLRQELANQPPAFGDDRLPAPLAEAASSNQAPRLTVAPQSSAGPRSRGHRAAITSLAADEAGGVFVSGSADGQVAVWRRSSETPSWIAGAHKSWVTSVAVSPDGSRVLSGGDDGTLYLWDTELGLRQGLHGLWPSRSATAWPPIGDCAFLPDGGISIFAMGRLVTIDPSTMSVVSNFKVPWTGALRSPIDAVEQSRAPDRFALITNDHCTIEIVDLRNGSAVARLTVDAPIEFLALAADAQWLAASDRQGRLTTFDLPRGTKQQSRVTRPLSSLCGADNGFFATDIGGDLLRIDSNGSARCVRRADPPEADRIRTIVSPGAGGVLIAGRDSGAIDLYDTAFGFERRRIAGNVGIAAGAFFGEGTGALVLEGSRTAQRHDVPALAIVDQTGALQRVASPHGGIVTGIAGLGGGRALTVDKSGGTAIWRPGRAPRVTALRGIQPSACASWQGRGNGVIGTSREQIVVMTLCRRQFDLHSTTLEFRAGISALAAAGSPLSVFAVYFNGLVRFQSGSRTWTGHEEATHTFRGTAAALSDDCSFAASGNLNGEIQIWECASGRLVGTSRLHDGEIAALAFVGAKPYLVSAGLDGQVYALDARTGQPMLGTLLSTHAVTLRPRNDMGLDALLADGQAVRLQLPFVGAP